MTKVLRNQNLNTVLSPDYVKDALTDTPSRRQKSMFGVFKYDLCLHNCQQQALFRPIQVSSMQLALNRERFLR